MRVSTRIIGLLALILSTVPAAAATAPSGLVSYWSFDESPTGTAPAQDPVGGNTGNWNISATRTAGLIGAGAAQFHNIEGEAVIVGPGVNSNFSVTTGITVEALFQSNWTPGASINDHNEYYDEIFRKEGDGDQDDRILLSFQADGNNQWANPPMPEGPALSFGLKINGTYDELDMPLDGQDGRPTLEQIVTGTHHVAATYDSASGEKSIYLDGARRFYTITAGLISGGGATDAWIGNNPNISNEAFTGTIDEVAFYNNALSASEIAAHYNNTLLGNNYFAVPEPTAALTLLLLPLALSRRR